MSFEPSFYTPKMIERLGHWNCPAPKGVWRVVATHSERVGGIRAQGETASILSWTNEAAQKQAMALLGLSAGELPDSIDGGECARRLALGSAFIATQHFDAGWAEADGKRPRDPRESITIRFLCFDKDELTGLACAFEAIAAQSGGLATHSSPELAGAAKAGAAAVPEILWNPDAFSMRREELDSNDFLSVANPGQERFSIDLRAFARHQGLSFDLSLRAPSSPLSHTFFGQTSFLNLTALASDFKALFAQDPTMATSLPCCVGESIAHKDQARETHQARQDAEALSDHLGKSLPTAAYSKKKSL